MKTSSQPKPHICAMRPHHLKAVLTIERSSFDWPWKAMDFVGRMQRRNVIGYVAEIDNRIAGYVVYALFKNSSELLNLAVAVDDRRRGIGRVMVGKLKRRLTVCRRRFLFATVGESNLGGQLFFRRMGFRAVEVLRRHFVNDEDAYRMRLDCGTWLPRD